MPTCKRKRVILNDPPQALLEGDPNREIYYLAQTGEIFENFEMYSARMSFYRSRQFQCEVTGKSNLDYFQAVASEQNEGQAMQSRFPEPLKRHVLRVVQWRVMGRLDHLVEAVHERFKDRFFVEEKIFIDIEGDKFLARVAEVYPPRNLPIISGTTKLSLKPGPARSPEDNAHLHLFGSNLDLDPTEARTKDNPADYYYKIQILDEEKDRPDNHHISKERLAAKETVKQKWSDSLMEVRCSVMSRDRLAFSKSILRRFIRDSVDREAAVASPWVVKHSLAIQYGLDLEMPANTREDVENIKKGEIEKRKKAMDEAPPAKKQKKTSTQDGAPDQKDGPGEPSDTKDEVAEKKKKKAIRYPTEDLDIRLTDRDLKAGMKIKRPPFSRVAVPFNEWEGTFESFIMCWNFFMVYSQPLHLSSFSLDEFEHALRHTHPEQPCQLLSEVHAALIYNLRTVTTHRHCAVLSLLKLKDSTMAIDAGDPSIDQLNAALADIGNNWERVPLRYTEGREGWEEALLGCLKDTATTSTFSDLRGILTRLLFAPESPSEVSSLTGSGSALSTPTPAALIRLSTPYERYYTLTPADKIKILSFMCDLAVSSKAIRQYQETSDEQLTALRKDKIEVNRTRKAHLETIANMFNEEKADGAASVPNRSEPPVPESSDLSDPPSETEDASESGSNPGSRSASSRQVMLRLKAQTQAHAKERQLAREKAAEAKQALAEKRRLEEEISKLDRRLEGIEREFRKLLGVARVKPLGRDRFYNRVWWFDGFGGASLLGSGGVVQYGSGRIFIQGPSQFDQDILDRRTEDDILARRLEEEGQDCILLSSEWGVYSDVTEMEEFVAWLNPKGQRELALKNTITKWWPHMGPGMRKRMGDVNAVAKLPEARRSSRVKAASADLSREPYMLWTNRRAVTVAVSASTT